MFTGQCTKLGDLKLHFKGLLKCDISKFAEIFIFLVEHDFLLTEDSVQNLKRDHTHEYE